MPRLAESVESGIAAGGPYLLLSTPIRPTTVCGGSGWKATCACTGEQLMEVNRMTPTAMPSATPDQKSESTNFRRMFTTFSDEDSADRVGRCPGHSHVRPYPRRGAAF